MKIIFQTIVGIIVNNFVILVTSSIKTRFLGKVSIKVQNYKGPDDERFQKTFANIGTYFPLISSSNSDDRAIALQNDSKEFFIVLSRTHLITTAQNHI